MYSPLFLLFAISFKMTSICLPVRTFRVCLLIWEVDSAWLQGHCLSYVGQVYTLWLYAKRKGIIAALECDRICFELKRPLFLSDAARHFNAARVFGNRVHYPDRFRCMYLLLEFTSCFTRIMADERVSQEKKQCLKNIIALLIIFQNCS